jgi:DNA-binding MarR family transcriptional regulator
MDEAHKVEVIERVMGSSHLFFSSVNDLLERSLAEASARQVSMSQVKLLLLISRPHKRFKVKDVADFLGVTNAAASRSIDRLVQRGLVDRTVTPEDRRAVDLTLTPTAENLLARFTTVRDRELLRLLGNHPAEKLERVSDLLDELSLLLLDPDQDERCLRCGVHFREECLLRDVAGRECVMASELDGLAENAGADPAGGPPQR